MRFLLPIQMNGNDVERFNYRSHLIAIVHEPKLDPWGRQMLPYITEHDKTPRMWEPNS